MSGFVGAVSLHGPGERAEEAASALAREFAELRGETAGAPGGEPAGRARARSVGCRVLADERGWTVVQGAAHGPAEAALSPADVERLDGQCSVASFDARSGRVMLATDRFGAAPVYVSTADGMLYFSTSAMTLARHVRSRASASALRNFLVSGSQWGPETHWESVRRLDPGTLLEVRDGSTVERSYWRAEVDPDIERLELGPAADRMLETAVGTLTERLAGREPWLDLTGGYDSRLLALLLSRAGVAFKGNTRQSSIGADIELAGRIAQAKNWPWQPYRIPDDWPTLLPELVSKALGAADGRLEVFELSRVVWVHQQLAASTPHLLSAGGGEHFQYYAWSSELPRPGRKQADIAAWVDLVAIRPSDTDVLSPGSVRATKGEFVDRLSDWVRPYRGEPSTRQLDACYAYKAGSGHFGAYRAADDLDLTAELPFFYSPVFSDAFSVHHRHRDGFRLMRELIHRLDKDIARIPTTRGGPAVPMRASTLPKYLPYYAILGRKGVNKISHKVTGRAWWPFPVHHPWPERESNAAVVENLQDRSLLDWDDLRIRALLTTAGVERLRRGETGASMLGRVLTAELALAATGTEL